jgi:hypothetical protein
MRSVLVADEAVVAELAKLCGRSPSYVNWHLSQETIVPACLLVAGLKFASQQSFRIAAHSGPAIRPRD